MFDALTPDAKAEMKGAVGAVVGVATCHSEISFFLFHVWHGMFVASGV